MERLWILHERGACRSAADPTLWYSDDPADIAAARTVCVWCPVRSDCATLGLREPAGMWGARTAAQREAAGDLLPALRYCAQCRELLDDDHPDGDTMHAECYRLFMIAMRKQKRRSGSADRACERCGAALSPQAQACLVCRHIVGKPLPAQPWRW